MAKYGSFKYSKAQYGLRQTISKLLRSVFDFTKYRVKAYSQERTIGAVAVRMLSIEKKSITTSLEEGSVQGSLRIENGQIKG